MTHRLSENAKRLLVLIHDFHVSGRQVALLRPHTYSGKYTAEDLKPYGAERFAGISYTCRGVRREIEVSQFDPVPLCMLEAEMAFAGTETGSQPAVVSVPTWLHRVLKDLELRGLIERVHLEDATFRGLIYAHASGGVVEMQREVDDSQERLLSILHSSWPITLKGEDCPTPVSECHHSLSGIRIGFHMRPASIEVLDNAGPSRSLQGKRRTGENIKDLVVLLSATLRKYHKLDSRHPNYEPLTQKELANRMSTEKRQIKQYEVSRAMKAMYKDGMCEYRARCKSGTLRSVVDEDGKCIADSD